MVTKSRIVNEYVGVWTLRLFAPVSFTQQISLRSLYVDKMFHAITQSECSLPCLQELAMVTCRHTGPV